MPDVIIKHRVLSQSLLESLRDALPLIVADVLSTDEPGRELSPNEISIEFRRHGDRDWHPSDLGVHVIANASPKRVMHNDENAAEIAKRLREVLSPTFLTSFKAFVWIQLIEGGFAFV